jgi:hypothetical protein
MNISLNHFKSDANSPAYPSNCLDESQYLRGKDSHTEALNPMGRYTNEGYRPNELNKSNFENQAPTNVSGFLN